MGFGGAWGDVNSPRVGGGGDFSCLLDILHKGGLLNFKYVSMEK